MDKLRAGVDKMCAFNRNDWSIVDNSCDGGLRLLHEIIESSDSATFDQFRTLSENLAKQTLEIEELTFLATTNLNSTTRDTEGFFIKSKDDAQSLEEQTQNALEHLERLKEKEAKIDMRRTVLLDMRKKALDDLWAMVELYRSVTMIEIQKACESSIEGIIQHQDREEQMTIPIDSNESPSVRIENVWQMIGEVNERRRLIMQ